MLYWIARFVFRAVLSLTIRVRMRGGSALQIPGGCILACSHVSHLDPFCLSALLPRKIGWMARIEFFRHPWAARLMWLVHAFPVNRRGVPVRAMRVSLQRLARGESVGIFPEGEVKCGAASVLRGGPIKRGVCLLAARSGRPVLPCIIVGTEKLNAPGPWMPMLRGRLWIFIGEPIPPVTGPDRRAARAEMAAQIENVFVALYARLRGEFGLSDSIVP